MHISSYELDQEDDVSNTCVVDILFEDNPGLAHLAREGEHGCRVFGVPYSQLEPIKVAEWVRHLQFE